MEPIFGRGAPGSPGAPLTSVSPNQQRYELENSPGSHVFDQEQRRLKDSSVLGKATLFEQMASQGKAHEKRTVESATLKRAEIAREEAEARCKQYKRELEEERLARRRDMQIIEEVKAMRNKISLKYEEAREDHAQKKERYSRTIETKDVEIKGLKGQVQKLRRDNLKDIEDGREYKAKLGKALTELSREKELIERHKQETLQARVELGALQDELASAIEKIKILEKERDVLKTIAKDEEIARIAVEGRLSLPKTTAEKALESPKKVSTPKRSASVISSSSAEDEIERLKEDLEWEKRQAKNAYDLVDYMKQECQFKRCSCQISGSSEEESRPAKRQSRGPIERDQPSPDMMEIVSGNESVENAVPMPQQEIPKATAVFIPSEGIFRTITPAPAQSSWKPQLDESKCRPVMQPPTHRRAPSFDPPAFAPPPKRESSPMIPSTSTRASPAPSERTLVNSRQSEARRESAENPVFDHHLRRQADPMVLADVAQASFHHSIDQIKDKVAAHESNAGSHHHVHDQNQPLKVAIANSAPARHEPPAPAARAERQERERPKRPQEPPARPEHQERERAEGSQGHPREPKRNSVQKQQRPERPNYHTISTTTRIPLAPEDDDTPMNDYPSTPTGALHRSASSQSMKSLPGVEDQPPMTKEEMLAMIREKRGRSKSQTRDKAAAVQTPIKRRDISAPGARTPGGGIPKSVSRSASARSVSRGRPNRVIS